MAAKTFRLAALFPVTCSALTLGRAGPEIDGDAFESSSERLRRALPLKWLHLPKTGSSFLNTLIHVPGVCPGIHPDFMVDSSNCGPFFESKFDIHCKDDCPGLSCPPALAFPFKGLPAPCSPTAPSGPNRSILAGPRLRLQEHHLGIDPVNYDLVYKGHSVTMLRQPEQRLLSAYEDAANGWPNDMPNDQPSNLMEFAQVMQGCYVRMFTRAGRSCGSTSPATAEELAIAKNRLHEGFVFVGITEEWELSMCLFHTMFGGSCSPHDLANIRPRAGKVNGTIHNMSALGGFRDAYDGELYNEAQQIFARNLETFGVSHEACSACYSQQKTI